MTFLGHRVALRRPHQRQEPVLTAEQASYVAGNAPREIDLSRPTAHKSDSIYDTSWWAR